MRDSLVVCLIALLLDVLLLSLAKTSMEHYLYSRNLLHRSDIIVSNDKLPSEQAEWHPYSNVDTAMIWTPSNFNFI